MQSYTTIHGQTLDLSDLTDVELAHFADAYAAYRAGAPYAEFFNSLVNGSANPLLRETGGWVTEVVWHHPLYRVVSDLGARLGIAQGRLGAEGDWQSDPLSDAQISPTEAIRS